MSKLIIDRYEINAPIVDIARELRLETNYYLSDIEDKHDYVRVTCPFHKNGKESKPACSIYARDDNDNVQYGTYHCLACGEKGSLTSLVQQCLSCSKDKAEDWLKLKFGTHDDEVSELNISFDCDNVNRHTKFLNENILKNFEFYHPYMWKRKLTREVVDRFQVGYDPQSQCITFPVYDRQKRLVMVTKRNVNTKQFYIPKDVEKPVYLLYDIMQNHASYKYILVCESQINALYAWSMGYPAIGLFGTGSDYQYDILRSCHLHNYILCFDGDSAGRNGAKKFINNIGMSHVYKDVIMPPGKDLNDLSKEQFEELLKNTPTCLEKLLKN